MKKSTIKLSLVIALSLALFSCSKDSNNDPAPTPTPTPNPADTRELVVQVKFVNPWYFPDTQDTLVDVPNMKIVLAGGQSDPSTLLTYYTSGSNTVNADANGIARIPYTSLGSYSVGSSGTIGIMAYNSPIYGAYGTNSYLESTTFSFDDRNTYPTIEVKVRAFMWQYLASFTKWNLVYASVNGVASDVTTTCNNDDYVVFDAYNASNGGWYGAKLTYFDGSNTCAGFPSPEPVIHYSRNFSTDYNGNPRLNARYNTTTNKVETTSETTISNEYASTSGSAHQNFWGYNITTRVMGDTLTVTSQEPVTGNNYIVVKKFVAVP